MSANDSFPKVLAIQELLISQWPSMVILKHLIQFSDGCQYVFVALGTYDREVK